MSVLADDDVAVHGNAQPTCDVDNRLSSGNRLAGGTIEQEATMRATTLILLNF
jgi:hypothetical protein